MSPIYSLDGIGTDDVFGSWLFDRLSIVTRIVSNLSDKKESLASSSWILGSGFSSCFSAAAVCFSASAFFFAELQAKLTTNRGINRIGSAGFKEYKRILKG